MIIPVMLAKEYNVFYKNPYQFLGKHTGLCMEKRKMEEAKHGRKRI